MTPTTTTRSMDSDDDFMTDVSSREEDFLDMQDSEDESLGEGLSILLDGLNKPVANSLFVQTLATTLVTVSLTTKTLYRKPINPTKWTLKS